MPTSYNYNPRANFPKAAIRYEISNNAAAHLATGLLIDWHSYSALLDRPNIITEKKVFNKEF